MTKFISRAFPQHRREAVYRLRSTVVRLCISLYSYFQLIIEVSLIFAMKNGTQCLVDFPRLFGRMVPNREHSYIISRVATMRKKNYEEKSRGYYTPVFIYNKKYTRDATNCPLLSTIVHYFTFSYLVYLRQFL